MEGCTYNLLTRGSQRLRCPLSGPGRRRACMELMLIPIIEIPVGMSARLLNGYEASTVAEPVVEEARPEPGHPDRYGVPLDFPEEYPCWKEYVVGWGRRHDHYRAGERVGQLPVLQYRISCITLG